MDLRQELHTVLQIDTYAQGLGFDTTCPVLTRNILLDERVRMQCQINLCGNYNKNLMCPPFLPTLSATRQLIDSYTFALLLQLKRSLNQDEPEEMRLVFQTTALQLNQMLVDLERKAFASGFHLALALGAGECKLCQDCVIIDGENQCRQPGAPRPSMEGMGIDVIQTFHNAGLAMDFQAGELTVAGLLLID
jgi:predicted metal-binding protein